MASRSRKRVQMHCVGILFAFACSITTTALARPVRHGYPEQATATNIKPTPAVQTNEELSTLNVPHTASLSAPASLHQGSLRTLQQTRPKIRPKDVTTVNTPEGLLAAIQNGALDILVTQHLDLTTLLLLPTAICEDGCGSPLGQITATRSLRGNCTEQPDPRNFPTMNGVAMEPTTSGQCFLLTNDDLLGIVTENFWADNLYLRPALPSDTERNSQFPALVSLPPGSGRPASVYLTNMIFQGDGQGSVVAIGADDKIFVQDSLFTQLGGARDLECTECSSAIEARAAVAVDSCRFEKPIIATGSRYLRCYKGGAVRFTNNTFDGAVRAFEIDDIGDDKAIGFWSDEPLQLQRADNQFLTTKVAPIVDVPSDDPDNPGFPLFLSEFDLWFVALREELLGININIPPPPPVVDPPGTPVVPTDPPVVPPTGSDGQPSTTPSTREPPSSIDFKLEKEDGKTSFSGGAIGGLTVAGIVVLMMMCFLGFVVWRVRTERTKLNNQVLGKQNWSDVGTRLSCQSSIWFTNLSETDVQLCLAFRENWVKGATPEFKNEKGAIMASVKLEFERGEKETTLITLRKGETAEEDVGNFKTGRMTVVSSGVEPRRLYFTNRMYSAGHSYIMEQGHGYDEVEEKMCVSGQTNSKKLAPVAGGDGAHHASDSQQQGQPAGKMQPTVIWQRLLSQLQMHR